MVSCCELFYFKFYSRLFFWAILSPVAEISQLGGDRLKIWRSLVQIWKTRSHEFWIISAHVFLIQPLLHSFSSQSILQFCCFCPDTFCLSKTVLFRLYKHSERNLIWNFWNKVCRFHKIQLTTSGRKLFFQCDISGVKYLVSGQWTEELWDKLWTVFFRPNLRLEFQQSF